MTRFQGVANLLRKRVKIRFPVSETEFEDAELVLRYLKVDHFAELSPFMDDKKGKECTDCSAMNDLKAEACSKCGTKDFKVDIDPEQVRIMAKIIKELIVETEESKGMSDEDLDALVSLNMQILTTAFTEMIQRSVAFMGAGDKKKLLEASTVKEGSESV